VDVVKGRSGHVVLVFNNTHRGRANLSVALSEDDGETWPWIRPLEDESLPGYMPGEYSYPCVIQTSDGLYHAAYTYRKTNIKHTVFNEAWVKDERGVAYPSSWYFSRSELPMRRRTQR
jgi:predicted neuraminidase